MFCVLAFAKLALRRSASSLFVRQSHRSRADQVVDTNLHCINRQVILEAEVIEEEVAAAMTILASEVKVKILSFDRPIGAEHIFETTADRPTSIGSAVIIVITEDKGSESFSDLVVRISKGKTALNVKQRAAKGIAKTCCYVAVQSSVIFKSEGGDGAGQEENRCPKGLLWWLVRREHRRQLRCGLCYRYPSHRRQLRYRKRSSNCCRLGSYNRIEFPRRRRNHYDLDRGSETPGSRGLRPSSRVENESKNT